MSQHFLLSAAARTLSLVQVMRMSDDEAFETFKADPLGDDRRRAGVPALRLRPHL